MNNQRTVMIHNRSPIILRYEWKKYATQEEEEQQKLKEMANLSRDEENAKNKLSNQSPDYMALLSRNFQNKMRNSQTKSFLFEDSVFFIQPLEGDIWPNSSVEVTIIFRPDIAQIYTKTAYCEVTGRESRLPLRLTGVGNGPKVQLSIERLDVGNIFIGSIHVYEVVLANKGFIDAIYSVIVPNTKFGKSFSFEPNEGLISPSSFQAINLTFGSNKLGDFSEIFEFTIDGKPEKCRLTVTGTVIPPTFKFDTEKIRFNNVSYGFKYSYACSLRNTSLVPMAFSLRVASDSETREISLTDNPAFLSDPNGSFNFKEFSIKPSAGIILPQSDVRINVEFVPHFIKKYETFLIVDIEDVGNDLLMLPLTARSSVPSISLLTSSIDLGRCFIYHTYEKIIRLQNDTPLKARYYILPSKSTDPFKFTSSQAEGVIEPSSIKEICVFVQTMELDDLQGDLLIKINGSTEPLIKCRFQCLSQGPVVQISPRDIDWGLTTVLGDSVRELSLTNESLIEARFKVFMQKRCSPWRVEPSEGVVPPCSEVKLRAICYLIDKIKYEDLINIEIEHSHTQSICIRASGAGCSIVSEPPIGNCIDFGTFFSGGLVRRTIKLTNRSSRPQNLSFFNEGRMVSTMNKREMAKQKAQVSAPVIFTVTPSRVELMPGESKAVVVAGMCDRPQLVEETQV